MTLEAKKAEAKKLLAEMKEDTGFYHRVMDKALDRVNKHKGFTPGNSKLTLEERREFGRLTEPLERADERMDELEAKLDVAEMELFCKVPKSEEEHWDIWLKFARFWKAYCEHIEVYSTLLDAIDPKVLELLKRR